APPRCTRSWTAFGGWPLSNIGLRRRRLAALLVAQDYQRPFLDTAFRLVEPLPAARARVVPGVHRRGAVRAADARVVVVVKLVIGHVVRHDVRPHLLLAPGGQRCDFHQLELAVPFDDPDLTAGLRLVATDTR